MGLNETDGALINKIAINQTVITGILMPHGRSVESRQALKVALSIQVQIHGLNGENKLEFEN